MDYILNEGLWALFAVIVSLVSLVASSYRLWAADRPILSIVVPFEDETRRECPARLAVLQIRNDGGVPARLTRIVRHIAVGENGNYPEPLIAESEYPGEEARSGSHVIAPNALSQRLNVAEKFWDRVDSEFQGREDVFIQFLLEYEDFMGRKFLTISQFRYQPRLRGFRLAWPGNPQHPQHHLAEQYIRDEVIVGFRRAIWHYLIGKFYHRR